MPEIVGARDIAQRLGLQTQVVQRWRERYPNFPKPLATVNGNTPVWHWSRISVWLAKTGRGELIAKVQVTAQKQM
jgi:hypothetical protein